MKFNKKVIIYSVIFFFVGFIVSPSEITKTVEKEVVKIVEVEVVKTVEVGGMSLLEDDIKCPEKIECPVNNSQKLISLYEQVLELDGQAFTIAADNMMLIHEAAQAGANMDIAKIESITALVTYRTGEVNKIANKKYLILEEIDDLK